MANLHLLIGIPGSGKSTYAKNIMTEYNCDCISSDVVRTLNPAMEESNVFPEVCRLCAEHLANNEDVILDATNVTPKVRLRNISEIKGHNVDFDVIAYYFKTDWRKCVERVRIRNLNPKERFLPLDVIASYGHKIIAPSMNEGFKDIVIINNNRTIQFFKKFFTLSYDDGVFQDQRFVELLNKYHLKCTFNINSGLFDNGVKSEERTRRMRMPLNQMLDLYRDHEVAGHSLTHSHLADLERQKLHHEIFEDKVNLDRMFMQNTIGFAYPFGSVSPVVKEELLNAGYKYARTTISTHSFSVRNIDLLEFNPTCKHNDPNLMELATKFVEGEFDKPQLFYVWGHSFEFDDENNWDKLEEFFAYISNREDIVYCTNKEAFEILKLLK